MGELAGPQTHADAIGLAVARNDQTRYEIFSAMVIADKAAAPSNKKKGTRVVADDDRPHNWGTTYSSLDNPFTSVKNYVCKYLC